MNILLDTHIALWALQGDSRLPKLAAQLIENESNRIVFSTASAWEVAINHSLHPDKMKISGKELIGYCEASGYIPHPIANRHIETLETLNCKEGSSEHNDPFEKIMLAQAKADGLVFLTHDCKIADYEEPCAVIV